MAEKPAPGVNPAVRKTTDRTWRPEQDGSTPLDTVSVQPEATPSVWPRIWAGVAIAMLVVTLLLVLF